MPDQSAPDGVFVYGTLQPGQSRGGLLRRLGLTETVPATLSGFDLYDLDPEGYPAIVPGSGTVTGSVLVFADIEQALPQLDALEGCQQTPPLYVREVHSTDPFGPAWVYVFNRPERLDRPGARRLPSGTWPPAGD
jgi:gamma-glutamylcyclotransferase (GGCT)/AIG2-like uncharacterized protein YtfP